jgi:hypothetical protein
MFAAVMVFVLAASESREFRRSTQRLVAEDRFPVSVPLPPGGLVVP